MNFALIKSYCIKSKTNSMIKSNQTLLLIFTLFSMGLLISCDPAKKYEKEERSAIQDYLSSNTDFISSTSGLYYKEITEGSGLMPIPQDIVFFRYTGMFLDGTVFDSNVKSQEPLSTILDEGYIISGLVEGIALMREGGKSIFLIPSNLAYGTLGRYPFIQGYTPLLFEIELVRVDSGSGR
jgi:FKBP-type peptidyl-prolyl cis-trans isomerase